MNLRLGLLRDTTTKDGAAEAQSKKHKQDKEESSSSSSSSPKDELTRTSSTGEKVKSKDRDKEKEKSVSKPRIRPLSEAKAIDSGANFISESFLFLVAGSLIVLESWRSRRKENIRKEDVAERLAELEENEKNARKALVALEKEILRLRAERRPKTETRILPKEIWEVEEETDERDDQKKMGFWRWLTRFVRREKEESRTERRDDVSSSGSMTEEASRTPQQSTTFVKETSRSSAVKA